MRLKIKLLIFALLYINCKAEVYDMPMFTNVSTFKDKGEINIGYFPFQVPTYKTIGTINTGYSITDKFSIIGALFLREINTKYSNKSLFDIGLGYYKNYDDDRNFSIYVGYSNITHCFVRNQIFEIVFRESFYINKYYIQPSISYNYDFIEFIFSSKFAFLKFYNTNSTYNKVSEDIEGQSPDGFFRLQLNDGLFFSWEPAITLKTGWKYIFIQAQVGAMITNVRYDYNGLFGPGIERLMGTNVNLGVVFKIP